MRMFREHCRIERAAAAAEGAWLARTLTLALSRSTERGETRAWRARGRSGFAMLQVICVVGVATVLSLAMLSSSVLQVQANTNRAMAMQADALADSGLNLALYYIENPLSAPMRNSDGYWPGENNISFGTAVNGTADVTVVRTATNTYSVTSTGRAGSGAGAQLSHTAKAVVKSNKGYTVNKAVSFNATGPTLIDVVLEIHGNVISRGAINLPLLHTVDGIVNATSITQILGLVLGKVKINSSVVNIPTAYTVNTYKTYTYAGQTYRATEIAAASVGGAGAVIYGPTADNPAGIYYYSYNNTAKSSTFTLNGNVTINGTLVVDNADLIVNGDNNAITAAPGYPALIGSKDFTVIGGTTGILGIGATGSDIAIKGLTWLGGSFKTGASAHNADVVITGALLFGGNGSVDSGFQGRVKVTYDATRASAPDLDTRTPNGPQIVSWSR